jgi:hypothetical protein
MQKRQSEMKLYHGTNCSIETIDLAKCRPYKDFGKGFYLTELEQQAKDWALRISERFGNKPKIIVYEYIPNLNLNLHESFGNMDNRNGQYDIVEGPVGNDDIAVTLNQFIQGLIDNDLLIKQLEYKQLNHQISFHTKNSITTLAKVNEYDL